MANLPLVTFNGGEFSPLIDQRSDTEKYLGGCRHLENFIPRVYGDVERRPGTKMVCSVGNITPQSIVVPINPYTGYVTTYFSNAGSITGISVNGLTPLSLSGAARDINGDMVALPCPKHPFAQGLETVTWEAEDLTYEGELVYSYDNFVYMVIDVSGTTNYDATYVLMEGTTPDELWVSHGHFDAETFTTDSRVVQIISLSTGMGHMVQDDAGNLYFGYSVSGGKAIAKITVDGKIDNNFFIPNAGWTAGKSILGMAISANYQYLYVYLGDAYKLYKFNIATGAEVWNVNTYDTLVSHGYDIAIDANDNIYIPNSGAYPANYYNVAKITSAGVYSSYTGAMSYNGADYDICVDDNMSYTAGHKGIIVTGGYHYCSSSADPTDTSLLYNMTIYDIDGNARKSILLGGYYTDSGQFSSYVIGVHCIITFAGYIYAVCNGIVYKLDNQLNVLKQATLTDARGLFADLGGDIVVIKQNGATTVTDIFHYYDIDLNPVVTLDHYSYATLREWANPIGTSYFKGNVAFWPGLGNA